MTDTFISYKFFCDCKTAKSGNVFHRQQLHSSSVELKANTTNSEKNSIYLEVPAGTLERNSTSKPQTISQKLQRWDTTSWVLWHSLVWGRAGAATGRPRSLDVTAARSGGRVGALWPRSREGPSQARLSQTDTDSDWLKLWWKCKMSTRPKVAPEKPWVCHWSRILTQPF